MKEVEFHIISQRGVSINLSKIKVVLNLERPIMVTKVKSFLGLAEYCKRFL